MNAVGQAIEVRSRKAIWAAEDFCCRI